MADLYKGGVQINRAVELDHQPMPVPMPVDTAKDPQNFGDFAGNAWNDVKTIGAGLGMAGSVGMARIAENAIDFPKLLNPLTPIDQKMAAHRPWDIYRPGDGQNLLNMTDIALQGYRDNYIDPISKGDFATPLKYAGKHPLIFATDVLPVAKSFTAPAQAVAKSSAVAKATSLLDKGLEKAVPFYSPMKRNVQGALAVQEAASKWNREFIQEAAQDLAGVEEAYNKVPKDLQAKLIEGGEMRDLAAHKELLGSAEAQDFLAKANASNEKIAQKLIQAGAMTEQEAMIAKYGPYTRATTGLSEDALWTPSGYGAVMSAKRALDAAGIQPTYFGLMTTPGVKAAIRIKGNLFERMPDKNFAVEAGKSAMEKIAQLEQEIEALKQALKQNPNELETQILRQKEVELSVTRGESSAFHKRVVGDRTAKHHGNAYEVHAAKHVEALQYLKLKDMFADLMSNPNVATVGSVTLDAHAFFSDIAKSAGMSPGGVASFLRGVPTTINMPRLAYDKMMQLMGNSRAIANAAILGPGAEWVAKTAKTLMLGYDVMWAAYQQGQNAMVYGYAAFQGVHPKEIAASVMGLALAFDKDVRNMAPAWWTADQAATAINATDAAQLLAANSNKLVKVLGAVAGASSFITDKVFGMASAGDNFWRSAYANYAMLRQIEKTPAGVQHALIDAFDIMSQKKQILAEMRNNPAARLSAGLEMEKWFGRYDQLMAQEWRTIRTVVPFWLWIAHAASITMSMPSRPIKTLMTARIAQVAPKFAQQGGLTESERHRGAVKLDRTGPNGYALSLSRTGATPFTQSFELAQQLGNLASGRMDETPTLPWLNGVLTFYTAVMGVDPQTMRPFRDPHLYQVQGGQYQADGKGGYKKVESTHPPFLNLIFKSLAQKQESQVREAIAFPYKPTAFTTIGDAAVARNPMYGNPLKNYPAAELMLLNFLKVKPAEQTFTPFDEYLAKIREQKKVTRGVARQTWRTQRDPTSLERVFQPQSHPNTTPQP